MAAASTRLRTESLERMLDTWALAVFSVTNSARPDVTVGEPARHQREDLELA